MHLCTYPTAFSSCPSDHFDNIMWLFDLFLSGTNVKCHVAWIANCCEKTSPTLCTTESY